MHGPDVFPDWPGPVMQTFTCDIFADALAMPPRDNAEGLVVRDLNTGAMLKIKQADYVAPHRIVTNLTARKIHEALLAGQALADFVAPLPDEFHGWCAEVAADITATVNREYDRLREAFADVVASLPAGWSAESVSADRTARAAFAKVAARYPDKWALFALLDDRDIRPELLRRAQPGPSLTPAGRTYTEDNT